jgi:hypothetical protein
MRNTFININININSIYRWSLKKMHGALPALLHMVGVQEKVKGQAESALCQVKVIHVSGICVERCCDSPVHFIVL